MDGKRHTENKVVIITTDPIGLFYVTPMSSNSGEVAGKETSKSTATSSSDDKNLVVEPKDVAVGGTAMSSNLDDTSDVSSDDKGLPKDEPVIPKDEAVVPKDEAVVPKDEAVVPKGEVVVPKELDIIAKMVSKKRYRYIGIDTDDKLKRPICYTPELRHGPENPDLWPKDTNLEIGGRYVFTLPEGDTEVPTHYPHGTEDIVVKKEYEFKQELQKPDLYNRLSSIAKFELKNIFPNLKENQYVDENTQCPSVGILKCREQNLEATQTGGKKCLKIKIPDNRSYNFKLMTLHAEVPTLDKSSVDEVLVLLGLGNPWDGFKKFKGERRCIVLALNIFKRNDWIANE